MKKILIITNDARSTYNFRKEIVHSLLEAGFALTMTCPLDDNVDYFKNIGVEFFHSNLERHGMNPLNELKLLSEYKKIIEQTTPDLILTFTVKPNTYGAIAASKFDIPVIANITGLGNGFQKEDLKSKLITSLYKYSFRNVNLVFFQNTSNFNYLNSRIKIEEKSIVLPGSGVNLNSFKPLNYPDNSPKKILYFGRLMESKGIYEYLDAIEIVNQESSELEYHFVGYFDDENVEHKFKKMLQQHKNIIYHGYSKEIETFIEKSDAVILPSHHEGMSNSLLEAAASARPLLASNIPGCKEIVEHEKNGFLFEAKNSTDIAQQITSFSKLDFLTRKKMGEYGRTKVESEFDRKIVVNQYMEEINKIIGGNYE
ncbi:glycosyltransferase family 4 protein [Erysipelothrix urinaevulpis]|uniref:glycosyltransferase family 4 protein n=1 Tax=Erysipelothrix urinaevulpis TaxID=2683717 RepID=UPI00135804A6|nr:glycosyltransferase family 4 protein [Erysipelothrix urinaevulpis]